MDVSKEISVFLRRENSFVEIQADNDVFRIEVEGPASINADRSDFAVWYVLPIAMALGKNIKINGKGSQKTVAAALSISELWSLWMPSVFKRVKVAFSEVCEEQEYRQGSDSLCLYSGGADSTYSIVKWNGDRAKTDLLTVWGMDYKVSDEDRFQALVEKTDAFAKSYSRARIFVRSNAYQIYGQYDIDTQNTHVSHMFSLTGATFMFSERYSTICISADYRLDQQVMASPWGGDTLGNKLFEDGLGRLVTLDDDVTRSEKLAALMVEGGDALNSLSFCVDYKSRPNNCGVCSKCMRTKLMFLASTGRVPTIFKDAEVYPEALDSINLNKKTERIFFIDLYRSAEKNSRLNSMPYLEGLYEKIVSVDSRINPKRSKKTKSIRRKKASIKVLKLAMVFSLGFFVGITL
jgi:hypothetical protein